MTDMTRVMTFRVEESMRQFLRKYAFEHEISLGEAIRTLIQIEMSKERANAQKE